MAFARLLVSSTADANSFPATVNEFKSFSALNEAVAAHFKDRSVILDAEIVSLSDDGKSQFYDLLFRCGEPRLCAFDVLWCDGENLCYAPLIERKQRLRGLLSGSNERLLYCDHIEQYGESLFRLACQHDVEGIVAKRKYDPYRPNLASWFKIRNPNYSQWAGREELFERERESDPDLHHWGVCVEACK